MCTDTTEPRCDHGEAGAEARWSYAGGRQGTGSHRDAGEVHGPQFINSNALSERCSIPAGMCCSPCPIGARTPDRPGVAPVIVVIENHGEMFMVIFVMCDFLCTFQLFFTE
jgi:hypothetical protein